MNISDNFREKPHLYTVLLMVENIVFIVLSLKFPEQMLKEYVLICQAIIVTVGVPIAIYGFVKWAKKIIK